MKQTSNGIDFLADQYKISVVVPCFKVLAHICKVIEKIGPEVSNIYCIDDHCPEGSGKYIEENCHDGRVKVLYNDRNLGVGGATITGYRQALQDGADIIVKIDGDGQMDPALIKRFITPIKVSRADYTKGNRFYNPESVKTMPWLRLFGNAVLSYVAKLSSGYWHITDPNNGYTAIQARVLAEIPLRKISSGYFFESDMLFRLNTIGAIVEDVPIDAMYADEKSNLKIGKILPEFLLKHLMNFVKRVLYNYYLRNFNVASIELVMSIVLLGFGIGFGTYKWVRSINSGVPVTAGTAMLASLPVILGIQFLLSFIAYDTRNNPQAPLHKRL